MPAMHVPSVEAQVVTHAALPPAVQASKFTHVGVTPPDDTYPAPQLQVQPPAPTTAQLEPASPLAPQGFIPVRHWLTQVVPSKEKPGPQPHEYPVFGATASVQLAPVLPAAAHGLP